MASGKKINSAADDAANLAISEKIQALINGLDKGTDNSYDMQGLLKTADGSMDTIHDSLQRIRELGVQAQNGIYNDSDKALLQDEINQLKDHISSTAEGAQFNGKNILDGTFTNMNTASYADGTGMQASVGNMSLESLGIENFDVTSDFDLSDIDKAIEQVSSARSSVGSQINRLDYTISHTQRTAVNQIESQSRILDTDYGKESINFNTNRIMQQYRNFSMKNQMANMGNIVNMLL
jgi:flagellin